MIQVLAWRGRMGLGVGLALTVLGAVLRAVEVPWWRVIGFASVIVFIKGCANYARAKGYSRAWGAAGVFGLIGALVVLLLPDRNAKPIKSAAACPLGRYRSPSSGGTMALGTRLPIGSMDELYLVDETTEDDIRRVADILVSHGIFGTSGASVHVSRHEGDVWVRFVVLDGKLNDPALRQLLLSVRGHLAAEVYAGKGVEIVLCDDRFATQGVL
jgi:hypothetical protein